MNVHPCTQALRIMSGTTNVSIRSAHPDDAPALGALLTESYTALLAPRYEAGLLSRALPLMTRANPRLLACGTYYVAETANGALVGCGGWTAERPGTGTLTDGEAHIRHFATHPARVGTGIGTRLLEHCIGESARAGFRPLLCFSTLNAETFYRRSGFLPIAPLAVPLTADVSLPAVLMRRDAM
ncbi:GNAT family N-acetyltransferase [Rhodoplanes roseus]|uniref:N-acetyltransferase domain-containing protein n=1 Tax=Rhodoplanes roseus TaxID=29409 RepID=A0A327L352_9BRAD|nr:GNAT family N-acetyltransferase [Rhodoplanes roseus]RAI45369.1 hypothetical protein CH341_04225 [Rhodoplanes roseus]